MQKISSYLRAHICSFCNLKRHGRLCRLSKEWQTAVKNATAWKGTLIRIPIEIGYNNLPPYILEYAERIELTGVTQWPFTFLECFIWRKMPRLQTLTVDCLLLDGIFKSQFKKVPEQFQKLIKGMSSSCFQQMHIDMTVVTWCDAADSFFVMYNRVKSQMAQETRLKWTWNGRSGPKFNLTTGK
jgi:hypothetical protein